MQLRKNKKEKEELISIFAKNIEQLINNHHTDGTYINTYSYVEIDGLPVDILIQKDFDANKYTFKIKITNNIIFLNNNNNNNNEDDEIILILWTGFNNIQNILEKIEIIKKNYKLVEHSLLSPEEIEKLNITRSFFPIPSDKKCSVCHKSTIEYTVCKHPICFRCRYNCIASNKDTCPICNLGKLNRFPNELIFHDPI